METLQYLSLQDITPNPYQPRTEFDPKALQELAQSIRENGLIQPLIVRPSAIVGYELLAGERRLRACQLAGLTQVPVIVKELDDEEMVTQSIIENLQRADLSPIEEAHSYKRLLDRGKTHEEIAQSMGKSRPYITNCLRLLQLTPPLQEAVHTGQLSQGHARLLITLPADQQMNWYHRIQESGMSVRQLEKALKPNLSPSRPKKKNLFIQEEEKKLSQFFGTPVSIQQQANGQGKISISFHSIEEFQRIIHNFK